MVLALDQYRRGSALAQIKGLQPVGFVLALQPHTLGDAPGAFTLLLAVVDELVD